MTWLEETSHVDPTIGLHRPHIREQRTSGLYAENLLGDILLKPTARME